MTLHLEDDNDSLQKGNGKKDYLCEKNIKEGVCGNAATVKHSYSVITYSPLTDLM